MIAVTREGVAGEPFRVGIPPGTWMLHYLDANGEVLSKVAIPADGGPAESGIDWQNASVIQLVRK